MKFISSKTTKLDEKIKQTLLAQVTEDEIISKLIQEIDPRQKPRFSAIEPISKPHATHPLHVVSMVQIIDGTNWTLKQKNGRQPAGRGWSEVFLSKEIFGASVIAVEIDGNVKPEDVEAEFGVANKKTKEKLKLRSINHVGDTTKIRLIFEPTKSQIALKSVRLKFREPNKITVEKLEIDITNLGP